MQAAPETELVRAQNDVHALDDFPVLFGASGIERIGLAEGDQARHFEHGPGAVGL